MGLRLKAVPRFHTTPVMDVGLRRPMRVVLTPEGPLLSLIAFMRVRGRHKSPSWENKYARAVGLLYDYWTDARPAANDGHAKREFFQGFADALNNGTIVLTPPFSDPPELFWPRFSQQTQRDVLDAVTAWSDWVAKEGDYAPMNPERPVLFHEQIHTYRQLKQQSTRNLLGHLDTNAALWERAGGMRKEVSGPRLLRFEEATKAFPSDKFAELLTEGFRRRKGPGPLWETHDIRGMMLAMLGYYTGLRKSEAFHLFVQDVEPEIITSADGRRTVAHIRLYHPSEGKVEHRGHLIPRSEYLLSVWGRRPLDSMHHNSGRAGWKHLLLTDKKLKCTDVLWVGPDEVGEVFWQLKEMYVTHVRTMPCQHPYLFVVEQAGVHCGIPYKASAWEECLGAAVKRIGLEYRKDRGTTPHGFRHALGQRMNAMVFPNDPNGTVKKKIIQRVLHHQSVDSQTVYTDSFSELHATLTNALAPQLDAGALAPIRLLIQGAS